MQSPMRSTRRSLARWLGLAPLALSTEIAAQETAPQDPALTAARAQVHQASQELASLKIPRATEPPCRFEA